MVQCRVDQHAGQSAQIRLAQRIAIPIWMIWIHAFQYTDLGEKGRTHSRRRPDPTDEGRRASGATLAAGEKPPHPWVQQRALLIMPAPHSEVTLESEADTPGLDTTHIRAGRGLSVVVAFKHSQASSRWLAGRAHLARPMTTPFGRAVCKAGAFRGAGTSMDGKCGMVILSFCFRLLRHAHGR